MPASKGLYTFTIVTHNGVPCLSVTIGSEQARIPLQDIRQAAEYHSLDAIEQVATPPKQEMGVKRVRVTWVDAHNNQGTWVNEEELQAFGKDQAYQVAQVGYVVYEDELCIVLASRLSKPSPEYGQSFGMLERIPKKLIDSMEEL